MAPVYRGGAIPVIQFLIDKGARARREEQAGLDAGRSSPTASSTRPAVLKRYPEAAALLRKTLRERGLPVPPPTHARRSRRPRPQPAAAGRTIWDGVFTEEQAGRGQKIYVVSCAPCHKTDLLGDSGTPALAGAASSRGSTDRAPTIW